MGNSTNKVLLVDDESHMLDVLKEYLAIDNELYGVLTASSGREALEIIAEEDVCLVVTDVKMPGMSGIQLLGEIRTHYPHIGVVIATAYGSPGIQNETEQSGCLHFLEKPIDVRELRQLICNQMDRKNEGWTGTLQSIRLLDIIHLCCLSAVSMAIHVKKGLKEGTIFIEDGRIIHAICKDNIGEEAFYQILAWESASFETIGEVFAQDSTIKRNTQVLLTEATLQANERAMENNC